MFFKHAWTRASFPHVQDTKQSRDEYGHAAAYFEDNPSLDARGEEQARFTTFTIFHERWMLRMTFTRTRIQRPAIQNRIWFRSHFRFITSI